MPRSPGYLSRVEASHVDVRSGPGVVFLRMTRDLEGEGEKTVMFAELNPEEARNFWDDFAAAIGQATLSAQERS